jgi:serine/threonine-protein kinase HipA
MPSTGSEVFVHARFGDGTTAVVGRYHFSPDRRGGNLGEFRYAGSWLRNGHGGAFALDPANLPLSAQTFFTGKRGGMFGALADATPDRWGQRLLRLTRPATASRALSPAELLLATGDERVGCLAFSQSDEVPAPAPAFLPFATRGEIADAFDRILAGNDADADPKLLALYRAGQSLGGVRPKAVIAHEGQLWIAKFQHHDDEIDECAAEHAAMRLAAHCSIQAAQTELVEVGGGRRAVLVRRFDRADAPGFCPSAHFLSALSLLDLEETSMEGSYMQIAGILRRHGAAHARDRQDLFRRMLFNVLCGNRDDHLKNHALLYGENGWRLAPAFDVVPQPGILERVQAIAVGVLGGIPTIDNCLSRCGEFGLSKDAAQATAEQMMERMRDWRDFFAAHGVPPATIERIAYVVSPALSAL